MEELSYNERLKWYTRFVTREMVTLFVNDLETIASVIEELISEGKISDDIKLLARVKGMDSALINDIKDGKALDDIFGVKIVAPTPECILLIAKSIEEKGFKLNLVKVTSKGDSEYSDIFKTNYKNIKIKTRDDGYEAFQMMIYNPASYTNPLIELLFRTTSMEYECNYGKFSHAGYKKESSPDEIYEILRNGGTPSLPMFAFHMVDVDGNKKILKINTIDSLIYFYPNINRKLAIEALKEGKSIGTFLGDN